MFLWGVIINVLLLIYMINKKDSLKVLYVYIVSICIYYLLVFKIPLFTFKDTLINFDFISLIVFMFMITTVSIMVSVYEKNHYFEEDLLSSFFNHLESKVIFIFLLSLFLMTDYFIINIVLLVIIYKLFKLPRNISYISINLVLLSSLVKNPLVLSLINNYSSNYSDFLIHLNIVYLFFIIGEILLLLLLSFWEVKVEKDVTFNWYYIGFVFLYGLVGILFYKDIGTSLINLILTIMTFASFKKIEEKDKVYYKRDKNYPVLIPFIIVTLIILSMREFVDYPFLMTLFAIIFIYLLDRKNKYSSYKEVDYNLLISFILFTFAISFFTLIANSGFNNNMSLTGSFKDYYNNVIFTTPNTIMMYVKSIFFSGYIFPANIDVTLLQDTLGGSYKVIFSISTSMLLMVPLQAIIIRGIKLKDNIKESIFLNYLVIIFSSIIVIYILV